MIQRREFIGSLAAAFTFPLPQTNGLAHYSDRNLRWKCDVIQTVPHDYGIKAPVVTGVSLQPNGNLLAIVGDDHYVCIFDLAKQEFIAHLGDHTDWVRTTKFSPDGSRLASAGNDRKLRVWNSANFEAHPKVYSHNHAIISIDFASDSNQLATVGFDNELRIYDVTRGQIIQRMRCECPDNHALAFSADNTLVAAGGRSGTIRVWDVASGNQRHEYQAHSRRIRSIQFTADGRIVSCGDDQVIMIARPELNQLRSLPRHSAKLFSAAILKNDLIATAGSDNLIHVWRMSDAAEIGALKGHSGTVSSLDFVAGRLASGSFDTQVRVWKYDHNTTANGRQT